MFGNDGNDNNEESLGTRADRERVKDRRTREQKLLDKIFDDASSPEECKTSIELLKKETGKDRSGLVEKYTSAAGATSGTAQGSSGDLGTLLQLLQAQATIRGLQDQLKRQREQEQERILKQWDMAQRVIDDREADIDRYEELSRQLASVASGLKSLRPSARAMMIRGARFKPEWRFEVDELIELARWVIDGPVKEAIAKANTTMPNGETEQSITRELVKLLADGAKTTGEIKVAVDARPKLRQLLLKEVGTEGEISTIKLGLHLKGIDGVVAGGMKLVGRRDAHRKQTIWMAEPVSG